MGHARVESLYEDDYPLPVLGQDSSQGAWHWCLARVQAAVLTGRDDDAAIWLPHIEQLMSQGMRVTTALGLAAKFAGLAAAAGGDQAAATKHFEEAIRLADALPHHTEQAETRRWYAWALERFGAPADKLRELRETATAKYDQLGGYNPLHGIPGQ
jgi:hypothetical protein